MNKDKIINIILVAMEMIISYLVVDHYSQFILGHGYNLMGYIKGCSDLTIRLFYVTNRNNTIILSIGFCIVFAFVYMGTTLILDLIGE